jgi:hypothetical protein
VVDPLYLHSVFNEQRDIMTELSDGNFCADRASNCEPPDYKTNVSTFSIHLLLLDNPAYQKTAICTTCNVV